LDRARGDALNQGDLDALAELCEAGLTDDHRRALQAVGIDAELLDALRVLLSGLTELAQTFDDRGDAAVGLRRQHLEDLLLSHRSELYPTGGARTLP
jgi:hypothetical protein